MSKGKVSSQHSKIPTHVKTQIFVTYGIDLFYDWHNKIFLTKPKMWILITKCPMLGLTSPMDSNFFPWIIKEQGTEKGIFWLSHVRRVNFQKKFLGIKVELWRGTKFEPINFFKNKNFFFAKGAQATPNGSLLSLEIVNCCTFGKFYFTLSLVTYGTAEILLERLFWTGRCIARYLQSPHLYYIIQAYHIQRLKTTIIYNLTTPP